MPEPKQATMIWNRACGHRLRTLPGDRALADLLRAHGLICNGGVLHAAECLSDDKWADAESGYRFYGLDDVADLLSRAKSIFTVGENLGLHERPLDSRYVEIIPDDSSLVERFEKHLELHPEDYAPSDYARIRRDSNPIGLPEWDAAIASHASLVPVPDRSGINPFTGEKFVVSGKGKAHYFSEGEQVGNASLQDGEVLTTGIPRNVCENIAQFLNASVFDDERTNSD